MTRLRKVIAQRMVESLHVSAQLTTVIEVDVTSISRLRDSVKADFASREGVKLSFMPFFAKAAIDALKAHPSLNAAIDTEKGEVTYYDRENLAIAVDTERGLLTPVIKEAGDLSIAGLARKIADVAERTRTNKITPDELSGGTFTLTNTGSRGALFDTPIINQPQVAILGTGAVVKRAVVIDDANLGETIAVRQMVYLALTYDHRLVDGADAARFLIDVKARLEAGQFEVERFVRACETKISEEIEVRALRLSLRRRRKARRLRSVRLGHERVRGERRVTNPRRWRLGVPRAAPDRGAAGWRAHHDVAGTTYADGRRGVSVGSRRRGDRRRR